MLLISSRTFCPNNKGFPVLSKPHQALLTKYMRLRPTPYILLTDIDTPPVTQVAGFPSKLRHDPLAYLIYIRHLQKNQPSPSTVERFGSGYQDYLQAPLQPLADNLESITYEVFEKDPVKYNQYEKAIKLALEHRKLGDEMLVTGCFWQLLIRHRFSHLLNRADFIRSQCCRRRRCWSWPTCNEGIASSRAIRTLNQDGCSREEP
jgi:hypothetical protein